ncbi:hypothetical protein ACE38W_17135 [Chitinophaga sp. Hz27]|uniref:hypothetical protein n=1 Tax=Chitinophaga sp. Hz27 TaxID=3347169 RepID=UPI0035E31633
MKSPTTTMITTMALLVLVFFMPRSSYQARAANLPVTVNLPVQDTFPPKQSKPGFPPQERDTSNPGTHQAKSKSGKNKQHQHNTKPVN